MATIPQATEKDEEWLAKDWRNEITIAANYKAHSDEFLQLLVEFEDM